MKNKTSVSLSLTARAKGKKYFQSAQNISITIQVNQLCCLLVFFYKAFKTYFVHSNHMLLGCFQHSEIGVLLRIIHFVNKKASRKYVELCDRHEGPVL